MLTHYVYNIMTMLYLTLVKENNELKIFSGH